LGQTNSNIDWLAVANDGGLCVLVVDAQGRVVLMNHAAATIFARRPARDVIGQRLSDFLPGPAAAERLEHVRNVIGSGDPVVFRDLWGGIALRCTIRRIDGIPNGGESGPAALVVCAPESVVLEETGEPTGRQVEAKHIDLGPLSGLTNSELKVLALIGEGLSNAEIAGRLHRAVKTVESHRAALTDKTGSSSRVQLGIMARRAGLSRRLGHSIANNGDGVTSGSRLPA
jgi:DNA-binding CsgD family transcriptional regulator